jgi:anaphase-promoting complex subunit 11
MSLPIVVRPPGSFPGEDSPVVWGKCGHAFHLQCVSKWLNQPSSKNSCPICRQDWEFGQNPGVSGS